MIAADLNSEQFLEKEKYCMLRDRTIFLMAVTNAWCVINLCKFSSIEQASFVSEKTNETDQSSACHE
jgi:hypothetical protein